MLGIPNGSMTTSNKSYVHNYVRLGVYSAAFCLPCAGCELRCPEFISRNGSANFLLQISHGTKSIAVLNSYFLYSSTLYHIVSNGSPPPIGYNVQNFY